MVNVNKKYLDNLKNSVWQGFLGEWKRAKNRNAFQKIFNKLFTPTEQIMLGKRLAILFLGKRDLSNREIGRILDVSPTTVGFIKKNFSKKMGARRSRIRGPNK